MLFGNFQKCLEITGKFGDLIEIVQKCSPELKSIEADSQKSSKGYQQTAACK